MAASDHLNGQLRMFMSPREVFAEVDEFNDFGSTPADMRRNAAFKLSESQASGMHDSIAAEGVKHPIEISHFDPGVGHGPLKDQHSTHLSAGHTRLVSQLTADPDRLMPVIHHHNSYFGKGTARFYASRVSGKQDPTGERGR